MDRKSLITVIYRLCYITLNLVFTIYETITSIVVTFRNKLCHEFLPVNKPKKITKIPTHLTVLLGNEEPAIKDLANLIFWCLAARITFVSFYDYKGLLLSI